MLEENKIHNIRIACLLQLKTMRIVQSKFTKKTQNMFKQGARPWCAGPGPRHCKDIVQGLNDVYWLKHETPKLLTNRR